MLSAFVLSACNETKETTMKSENAVIDAIMGRRSIRKYNARPVDRDTVNTILKCGINAPNGMNRQSWEVRVMDNPEMIAEMLQIMREANPDADPAMVDDSFRGAPTIVFIANDPSYEFSQVDCGLMAGNICLSAYSLGVGSICLGIPVRFLQNTDYVQERLGFSPGYELLICVGLGYPEESPKARDRDFSKVKFLD